MKSHRASHCIALGCRPQVVSRTGLLWRKKVPATKWSDKVSNIVSSKRLEKKNSILNFLFIIWFQTPKYFFFIVTGWDEGIKQNRTSDDALDTLVEFHRGMLTSVLGRTGRSLLSPQVTPASSVRRENSCSFSSSAANSKCSKFLTCENYNANTVHVFLVNAF